MRPFTSTLIFIPKLRISYSLLILFSIFLLLTPNHRLWAQNEVPSKLHPYTHAYKTVDSLNELAFEVKRHHVDKALTLLNTSANLAIHYKYSKGEATSLLYEAGIFHQNGYSKRALSLYYKALEISKTIKDTFNIARANQQIGNALMEMNKLEEAEVIFKEAMSNYVQLHRAEDVINIKNYLGLINLQQQDVKAAEQYLEEALQESKKNNYHYGSKKSNYNLGLLHLARHNLRQASAYLKVALTLDQQKNDRYGLSLTQNKLSEVTAQEGNLPEAIALATAALQDAQAISAMQLEIATFKNLAGLYKKQQDYVRVAEMQEALIKAQETLFEKERTYAIDFLDMLKQKQEEQLGYEKQAVEARHKAEVSYFILFLVILGLIIISFVAFMWYKNYQKAKLYSKELKNKNEVIEANAAQLNELNQAILKQNTRLEEAILLKNKLISIISHDLRLPLVNTKGLLQVIQEGVLSNTNTLHLLSELEKQYGRSLSLLDSLLFWMKSQMQGTIELRRTDLKSLLEDIIQEQEIPVLEKKISILNEVAPNLAVLGDKEMLKVIFRNLLSNSLKFTKTNGKVKLNSLVEASKAILIQIEDEGIGMTKEHIQNIKNKKYFSTRGTQNELGTGIGLMICLDLVNRHGGDLQVESELHKGTRFTVRLPYTEQN
ncbi:tetratricopeptide repeat-containing sensor histidine kinase [Adhaeribacter aquaticus]|uniref:tetratricopeptide repeat-containing sensor histidine kinase n=1 Tax=Adhaeribacter aquaticus TaxID=299567 RepID=UPI0003FC2214|nr:tetratricopeptide repeat-containing sensor histidine kinase [Adhaeribacter aquaticus]